MRKRCLLTMRGSGRPGCDLALTEGLYRLVTAPAVEPISTDEAKSQLRVTFSTDDTYIAACISAARRRVENEIRRALITQTWDFVTASFPCDGSCIELEHTPIQSITSISYYDIDGASQTWSSSEYQTSLGHDWGTIKPEYGYLYPQTRSGSLEAVTVRFVCGYGLAAAVPDDIKHAIKLIVGHMYRNREEVVTGVTAMVIPKSVDALLSPYRDLRFM